MITEESEEALIEVDEECEEEEEEEYCLIICFFCFFFNSTTDHLKCQNICFFKSCLVFNISASFCFTVDQSVMTTFVVSGFISEMEMVYTNCWKTRSVI